MNAFLRNLFSLLSLFILTTATGCPGGGGEPGEPDGSLPTDDTFSVDASPAPAPGCGNGVLDPGEKCDPKIPAGKPGSCPQSCADGNSCTDDTLLAAGTCNASCSHTPITTCKGGDGCCPAGCTSKTDSDCSPSCGNGVVDPLEKCDTAIAAGKPGACPHDCDDGVACTSDTLLYAGGCSAQCSYQAIVTCQSGDGCCPAGCTSLTDSDCSPSCGNGVVEALETCDTAIAAGKPGACPQGCNDGNACTIDTLLGGGTCSASCSYTAISACQNGDGCCPTGCTTLTDSDCSPSCGNGTVEPPETCDKGITPGNPGACPQSCNDGKACTNDWLLNAGTCNAVCSYAPISACKGGDGCCPTGCTSLTDSDCSASCGNGLVEPPEICDIGIASGKPGACPQSCNDGNACTVDTLLSPGTCSASCSYAPISACKSGDGCCPTGCTAWSDTDCGGSPTGTCAGAQILTLTGGKASASGSTKGLVDEFPTLACGTYNVQVKGPQAYYKLFLDASKMYRFQVTAAFSAYVYVFSAAAGCAPSAIQQDCQSNGTTGTRSYVSAYQTTSAYFRPAGSGSYLFAIDSASATAAGKYALEIEELPAPTNVTCAAPKPIALGYGKTVVRGTNYGAPNEFTNIKCGGILPFDGPQVYYKLYLSSTNTYRFLFSPEFSSYLYLFLSSVGCSASSIEGACSSKKTGAMVYANSEGTRSLYFTPAQSGDYTLAIDAWSTLGGSGAFTVEIEAITPDTSASTCAAPQQLWLTGGTATFSGDTYGLANEFGTSIKCGDYSMSGPQRYHLVNMTAGMLYELSLTTTFDGYLYVSSPSASCTASAIDADCASGGAFGDRLRVSNGKRSLAFVPPASGAYRIVVDSTSSYSSGYSGYYTLSVREQSLPTFLAPLSWSFDGDCKGLARNGDWECGLFDFLGNNLCSGFGAAPPPAPHSGSGLWGTTLNGCHALGNYYNSAGNKYPNGNALLAFRVTIPSSWSTAKLSFWSWEDIQLPYEGIEVRADGVPVYQLVTGQKASPLTWVQRTVDLSAYAGKTVRLSFHLLEDSAVQYSGWYVDDLSISGW